MPRADAAQRAAWGTESHPTSNQPSLYYWNSAEVPLQPLLREARGAPVRLHDVGQRVAADVAVMSFARQDRSV